MTSAHKTDPASEWISAQMAAEILKVNLATLYTYVSRGLLHPKAEPGAHSKQYHRAEVEWLRHRHGGARQAGAVARATLDFGMPVLASALCLIERGRIYYRGRDVIDLAETASLEEIAGLLWGCRVDELPIRTPPLSPDVRAALARTGRRPTPAWLPATYRIVADGWAADIEGDPPLAGWRCVQAVLLAATAGSSERTEGPLHEQLQRAWALPRRAADALRRAMVLAADHELNVSSFTARCVASTGANAQAAVGAALAALSGPRHGAMIDEVEALWPTMRALDRQDPEAHRWLADTTTQPPPGFGHRLYPEGDPRGIHLLERLSASERLERFVAAVRQRHGRGPTLDFGLVATCHAVGAPPGAAFALFAVARTVGWVAHVIEQQRTGALIRPRAAYVGERPPPSVRHPGRVVRSSRVPSTRGR